MKVETIEIGGLVSALGALRLSYGKEPRSVIGASVGLNVEGQWCGEWYAGVDERDLDLLKRLVRAGDEHAKVLRGVVVWVRVKAPVYWWCEMECYRAGHERLMSESTMHIDCRGLSGEELQRAKAEIPMGKELQKVDMFSYQCLRNIWKQRKGHRLSEWHEFCRWIEGLPLAEELITIS